MSQVYISETKLDGDDDSGDENKNCKKRFAPNFFIFCLRITSLIALQSLIIINNNDDVDNDCACRLRAYYSSKNLVSRFLRFFSTPPRKGGAFCHARDHCQRLEHEAL